MRSAGLVTLGVLGPALFLGGCIGNEDAGRAVAATTILQQVDGGEIKDVEALLGLQESSPGQEWTWNVLDGMERDSVRLLAVQALADAVLAYEESHAIDAGSPLVGGEQESFDAVCLFDLIWKEAPGDFFLARATGQSASYPDDVPWQGTGGSARGNGGGGGSGQSSGSGTLLEPGEWMLFAVALAGYDPGLALTDGGHWTIKFGSRAPLRIVELAPASYHCGAGFRSLEGGASTPGPLPAYQDRTLTSEAIYGADFAFCPQFDPVSGATSALANKASIDFLGNRTTLSPAVSTHLQDGGQGSMTLDVESWAGSPWWSMTGMKRPGFSASFLCS